MDFKSTTRTFDSIAVDFVFERIMKKTMRDLDVGVDGQRNVSKYVYVDYRTQLRGAN